MVTASDWAGKTRTWTKAENPEGVKQKSREEARLYKKYEPNCVIDTE
jgi:hypothetical protein